LAGVVPKRNMYRLE